MQKSHGGPAFPRPYSQHDDRTHLLDAYAEQSGMTLRDWFAGQALAGLTGAHNQIGEWTGDHPRSAARTAYDIADAMLVRRGGG